MSVTVKIISSLLLFARLLFALAALWLWPRYSYLPAAPAGFTATPFDGNPIISS